MNPFNKTYLCQHLMSETESNLDVKIVKIDFITVQIYLQNLSAEAIHSTVVNDALHAGPGQMYICKSYSV